MCVKLHFNTKHRLRNPRSSAKSKSRTLITILFLYLFAQLERAEERATRRQREDDHRREVWEVLGWADLAAVQLYYHGEQSNQ